MLYINLYMEFAASTMNLQINLYVELLVTKTYECLKNIL